MINLYWQMYKSLEREVLNLSDCIHFDDKQLSTYSVKIADLLTRCAIEIEAISKDLYVVAGGLPILGENGQERNLFFDTDCIQLLDKKWGICKRIAIITAPNFYFDKTENKQFCPLKKANKHGECDWKRAYQAVKHNRVGDLEKGNIKHLLKAMAALFLLNIYYKDICFEISPNLALPDLSFGSDLFAITSTIVRHQFYTKEVSMPSESAGAVYIIKAHDEVYSKYQEHAKAAFSKQSALVIGKGHDATPKSRNEIFSRAAELDIVNSVADCDKYANNVFERLTYEAVLNKSQIIYKEDPSK